MLNVLFSGIYLYFLNFEDFNNWPRMTDSRHVVSEKRNYEYLNHKSDVR